MSDIAISAQPFLFLMGDVSAAIADSSSGSDDVLSGAGAPVADPGVAEAIYFDTNDGTQYNWYSGAWH